MDICVEHITELLKLEMMFIQTAGHLKFRKA